MNYLFEMPQKNKVAEEKVNSAATINAPIINKEGVKENMEILKNGEIEKGAVANLQPDIEGGNKIMVNEEIENVNEEVAIANNTESVTKKANKLLIM